VCTPEPSDWFRPPTLRGSDGSFEASGLFGDHEQEDGEVL